MAVRIAFLNSGLGVLPAAVELRRARPDADVVLTMDPDGMPWGPRDPADITARALMLALAAAEYRPDVLVVACNTASVHALEALRDRFEPQLPVVGTVPAVKPATSRGGRVAVWATEATTRSDYQQRLVAEFAPGGAALVACPGLAAAVHRADRAAVEAAVRTAAAATPPGVTDVVLGCTEYELVPDVVAAALPPGVRLHGTARAVVSQALRRLSGRAAGSAGSAAGSARAGSAAPGRSRLDVVLSGRAGVLPVEALAYAEGRLLAATAPTPAP